MVFDTTEPDTIWRAVSALRAMGVPFNLVVVRGQTAYLFGRAKGAGIVPEAPWGVLAISELMGYHIIADKTAFETVREDTLFAAMRKTTLSIEELWAIIRT